MSMQLSATELRDAFEAPNSSTRFRTALAAGTTPRTEYIDVLVRRCAVEPDFFVRDMLTWALTRHDAETTVDRLLRELRSAVPQARSQALHTLTKIGDRTVWRSITPALLRDEDDEVARAAWRAAAGLVPVGQESALAELLVSQLGRGGPDIQVSLGRAFAVLGQPARGVVDRAARSSGDVVRAHALAIARLMDDPASGFEAAVAEAVAEARRTVARG
ncbi:HEAT repeat domain-containing protein [Curtobacterium sp. RRHDQ10]|uniref:HEAT repeat domain-containing protein n=1 Tax=Curtobacterium phyllosphaerae TaxID=3413379 RepID=UPI003BEF543D